MPEQGSYDTERGGGGCVSESRPFSGMASGTVLRPSAQVDEGQSRTQRVRVRERDKKGQRDEGQRYGKYLS